jgi:hypothetical protein
MGQAKQRGNFEERKEQALESALMKDEQKQIKAQNARNRAKYESLLAQGYSENEIDDMTISDEIGSLSPYFRAAWVNSKHEIEGDYESEIAGFECRLEISLSTEKNYEYIEFESDNAFDLIDIAKAHADMLEFRHDRDNPNPSNRTYIIKYANGEGNAITFEHAQTEEGKKALAFAKAAGEEVLFLNTDDAMDMFIEMCGNADLRCDA